MAEFNLSRLFENAFGYQPPKDFDIDQATDRGEQSGLGGQYYKDDLFGREMFMPVTINGYLLPFAVISIVCKKTIVETALVERKGTVKELINTEDYAINVKGIIVRPDNNFPENEIIDLHELFKLDEALKIESVLTRIFITGDDKVILKSLSFPPVAGVQHAKAFEMDFVSDSVYTLEIN